MQPTGPKLKTKRICVCRAPKDRQIKASAKPAGDGVEKEGRTKENRKRQLPKHGVSKLKEKAVQKKKDVADVSFRDMYNLYLFMSSISFYSFLVFSSAFC